MEVEVVMDCYDCGEAGEHISDLWDECGPVARSAGLRKQKTLFYRSYKVVESTLW